jgi:hypothetical protein
MPSMLVDVGLGVDVEVLDVVVLGKTVAETFCRTFGLDGAALDAYAATITPPTINAPINKRAKKRVIERSFLAFVREKRWGNVLI